MSKESPNGETPLHPLDLALLEVLPDEGQMLGYKPIALQVTGILKREDFKHEDGNTVAGRLRHLKHLGYAVSVYVLPVQRGLGWQKTPMGKKALERAKRGVTV